MTARSTVTATEVAALRRATARRGGRVTAALIAAIVVVFTISLCVGSYPVSPAEVLRLLLGQDMPGADFVVLNLRLPRALTGVAVGLAFGLAGTVFQSLLRNPLASPDVIGINAGASAGAVLAVVLLGASRAVTSLAALAGAGLTAVVIWLLARRGTGGYRLVLVGVGMAAVLNGVVAWALTRAQVYQLSEAMVWLTGSLNVSSWDRLVVLGPAVAVLACAALASAGRLRTLRLGDEIAAGLGTPVERSRLALLALAVAMAAVATAAAGPVAFVALLSGPVALRLRGRSGYALLPAGLVGALLVLLADLVAQHAVPGIRFPVGVVTGVLGAAFLIRLLVVSNRSGRGA